jgi:acetylornithine deacetylase/succinyl-diaminopimelate desuccinylase-like protein
VPSSDRGLSFAPDDAGYLRELAEFVAVPSVSRDASADTMRAAARWLAGQLEFARGRVVETDGHPVVRGEWLGAVGPYRLAATAGGPDRE